MSDKPLRSPAFTDDERGDWPTGNYCGVCFNCNKRYVGPKRSRFCFQCTDKKGEEINNDR